MLSLLNELKYVNPIDSHIMADALLLLYIDDKEISDAYYMLEKYYDYSENAN